MSQEQGQKIQNLQSLHNFGYFIRILVQFKMTQSGLHLLLLMNKLRLF